MDGIEAANEIRSRFNIPIIYLTAYADEKILERAKITKPFGYIVKPFINEDLKIAIELALYRHKDEKERK
jgi:CheY-like chemotaxis protein